MSDKSTHFGFQTVAWQDKQKKVADVFHSVADKYDIMNDLMSLGVHRLWKKATIDKASIRPGHRVLDLAGGSGDLTCQASRRVGEQGEVVLADINEAMLQQGRANLLDKGILKNVRFIQANAESLPFPDNHFDRILIGFGLRNVTDKAKALRSMYRVCRPGGKLLVLEFSTPNLPGLKPIYDWYSFNILPKLGKLIANDEASYRYLAESIRMHPDQKAMKKMIEQAGFEDCHYDNFTGGVVALHIAYKY
ncbi:bifunctional demethylmenaquinone methyltransferase/2-methoxy-6-polyprenyl-1,4-benzoquinol methylase UbiE [Legionella sp. W05-934-2]|jgi:demethylmenaquinone methyltransferase/2-methoxy-6-polyprenyl-1,4-benzoquinol methylase|uniref:bifunctional demethylmenaquinone methyltransferase/2-methoxy-6-polyprenyl-1,4-benzoquinol methylase UbiE n=1 Tax=Legionella sp. W05-934-2 TaxID=1198649 RepID=UPI003462F397